MDWCALKIHGCVFLGIVTVCLVLLRHYCYVTLQPCLPRAASLAAFHQGPTVLITADSAFVQGVSFYLESLTRSIACDVTITRWTGPQGAAGVVLLERKFTYFPASALRQRTFPSYPGRAFISNPDPIIQTHSCLPIIISGQIDGPVIPAARRESFIIIFSAAPATPPPRFSLPGSRSRG